MTKVAGIGGIFIDSTNAEQLAGWYTRTLGIEFEPHPDGGSYFSVFFTRDPETSILRENPVFAINQVGGPLPPETRGFILNLRVDNLDTVLDDLRAKNITIDPKILVWSRGKHAWIRDHDGNRLELYEELFPEET